MLTLSMTPFYSCGRNTLENSIWYKCETDDATHTPRGYKSWLFIQSRLFWESGKELSNWSENDLREQGKEQAEGIMMGRRWCQGKHSQWRVGDYRICLLVPKGHGGFLALLGVGRRRERGKA